ncbi:MAG: DedA family protein [Candidatus Binataceae bacterium]|jgi:membrane protein DedA with SNARE-associated domain
MHSDLSVAGITYWLASWGYLGLFLCTFVGNLGLPVPEETVLLAAGFLAGREILDLKTVYAVGIASAVIGDCAGFVAGRTGGQRFFEWLGRRFPFVSARYNQIQEFFQTHGTKAVFMARFVAGARFMAGPMAGAAGMRFWRFLGWNLFGALIWCSLVITVGYLLGDELEWVATMVHRAGYLIGLAVIAVLAVLWLFWPRRQPRPQL